MYALRVKLTGRPSPSLWDLVSGFLFRHGTCGIDEGESPAPEGTAALAAADEFQRAILPGTLDPPESFLAYFETPEAAQAAQASLEPHLTALSPTFDIAPVAQDDTGDSWKENFRPSRVPPFWVVRAPWDEPALQAGEVELVIEPGMAFGTGSHETTRSCLELLAAAAGARRQAGDRARPCRQVLDFGCGSGILAIALKKLGAENVYAVDIDPLALEATRRNAMLSGVEIIVANSAETIELLAANGPSLDGIAANILRNTLLEHAERFAGWLKDGAFLVLSGLLEGQEADVLARYLPLGFVPQQRIAREDASSASLIAPDPGRSRWVSLLLERRA